jgi:protein-S-isoprenylcysteine O-methyltransferase Ste14
LILHDVLEQANVLEKFLMDSFTLLMSSISVMEAGSIKEQAQQGQMITRLAFLYVPLSFVTGIFSMNVKEINGSPLPMWVPVAAFLVVSACTLGILFLWRWKQTSRYAAYSDYDLQIGVWDVRGEWFGGGKASQIFRYQSHLSPGA